MSATGQVKAGYYFHAYPEAVLLRAAAEAGSVEVGYYLYAYQMAHEGLPLFVVTNVVGGIGVQRRSVLCPCCETA